MDKKEIEKHQNLTNRVLNTLDIGLITLIYASPLIYLGIRKTIEKAPNTYKFCSEIYTNFIEQFI